MIPAHERRILEAHVRGVKLNQLAFVTDKELNEYERRELKELIKLRLKGIPLQYLTNSQDFYGREFYVNPGALIPRPETEGLVEKVLASLPAAHSLRELGIKQLRVLDFGTGSGCIGITLALERPDLVVWGSEASEEAAAVAMENARKHRVANFDVLRTSDPPLLWQYDDYPGLDVIVSNPPYLLRSDNISEDVRQYEPPEALFAPSEESPCFYYSFLATLCNEKLNPQGFGLFEIAENRARETAHEFEARGFSTTLFKDLTERDRYLMVTRS